MQENVLIFVLVNDINKKIANDINQSGGKAESFSGNINNLIKVKKLDTNAVIPSYSKVGDAGMDLTITREIENTSFSVSYGFGIAIEIHKTLGPGLNQESYLECLVYELNQQNFQYLLLLLQQYHLCF